MLAPAPAGFSIALRPYSAAREVAPLESSSLGTVKSSDPFHSPLRPVHQHGACRQNTARNAENGPYRFPEESGPFKKKPRPVTVKGEERQRPLTVEPARTSRFESRFFPSTG
mgnify:CR=1 FL=1